MREKALGLCLFLAVTACGSDQATQRPDDAAPQSPAPADPGPANTDDAPAAPQPEAPAMRTDVEVVPLEVARAAQAVVDAPDRTEKDRGMDARRHPGELLTFVGVQPGWTVADLGSGAGYTVELLVRAVGPEGKVYAQNNKGTLERFVSESWPARLARPINAGVVRVDREFADPLPPEARGLDAVTLIFSYHDVVVAGDDRAAMNKAVFDALKPGGIYVIADHHAAPGSGLAAAASHHRLERDILVQEVTAAGFVIDEEGQFLRDPSDDLSAVSWKIKFKTDRYVIRFKKPDAA